ncbi:hypothetical protein C8R46DRAFT_1229648 [Mycena filopes]|nr:hypothetical protein C8R46DRAFT_1229648 [Mycena filopes]
MHLCLINDVRTSYIDKLLRDCPRLELLLVLVSPRKPVDASAYAHDSPSTDIRFVVTTKKDYRDDWEAGAMGLPDYWSRTVDFVKRRRDATVAWKLRGVGYPLSLRLVDAVDAVPLDSHRLWSTNGDPPRITGLDIVCIPNVTGHTGS